jgi:putative Holliday junction resolvase
MALDVGDQRIGVALSDPTGTLASAIGVVERTGLAADVKKLVDLITAHCPGEIIVGNPVMLSGEPGRQSERVQRFVDALRGGTTVPIKLWDERMSTVAAGRRLSEAGYRREKRRSRIDAAAAAVFLQDYLDYMREQRP